MNRSSITMSAIQSVLKKHKKDPSEFRPDILHQVSSLPASLPACSSLIAVAVDNAHLPFGSVMEGVMCSACWPCWTAR